MPEKKPGDRRILIEDVYDEDVVAEIQGLIEQVKAAQRAALTPLIERFNNANAKAAEKEQEAAALRREASALRNQIRDIDREALPSAYARTNGKKKSKSKPFGHALQVQRKHQEDLARLTDWLQKHKDELNAKELQNMKGFRAIDIESRVPWVGTNLTKWLGELHDQGILQLTAWKRGADHSKTGGQPSGKFYKVI